MSVKIERINNMLVEQISYILATEIKDNDIKFVTITDVKTTNDLSFAKVYFTVLNERRTETLEALNNAKGYIRRQLSDRIEIRHIPELTFVYDESIEYGQKIETIIEQINEGN
ncbi:MAG: 30S ribosome-binding factor RbfA [Bacilli bacterium]